MTYKNNDLGSTIQILTQGKEFYPDNAKLPYLIAGYQLLADDPINARITLIDALKLDLEKLFIFEEEFPQFAETEWALNIISDIKKTSR